MAKPNIGDIPNGGRLANAIQEPPPAPKPPKADEVKLPKFPTGITLKYGKVDLVEVNIRSHNRRAEFHGPDYLYTVGEIHGRALYTFKLNTSKTQNNFAARDRDTVQDFLLPRQNLTLKVLEEPWVNIGGNDYIQGPIPLYCNIVEIIGPKTAWVDFGIRYAFHDSLDSLGKPKKGVAGGKAGVGKGIVDQKQADVEANQQPLMLSHRWSTTQVENERFWESQTISGEIVFNALRVRGTHPVNKLYKTFLQPIKPGWKRDAIALSMSEDGLIARYSYTDSQIPYVILPGFVADASITMDSVVQQATTDDINMAAIGMYAGGISSAVGIAGNYQSNLAWNSGVAGTARAQTAAGTGALSQTAGAGISAIGQGLSYQLMKVPSIDITITCTVFGRPYARMDDLYSTARFIAGIKADALLGLKNLGFKAAVVRADTRMRTCSYQIVITRAATNEALGRFVQDAKGYWETLKAKFAAGAGADQVADRRPPTKPPAVEQAAYVLPILNRKTENFKNVISTDLGKPTEERRYGGYVKNLPDMVVAALSFEGPGKEKIDTDETRTLLL